MIHLALLLTDSLSKGETLCRSPRFRPQILVAAIIRLEIHREKCTAKNNDGSGRNLGKS